MLPTRLALVLAVTAASAPAQAQAPAPAQLLLDSVELRELGPAVMGGRVADLAVNEARPAEYYVAFATGGVWKTTNDGMSWTPLFDDQPTASIGAVALAPSNPNVVYVGTGEPQNRQSITYGEGVFKSMDGGRTWTDLGLDETRQIAGIVVHPTDPDIVWVAASGHLWGPNEERGVYKTTDGGATWSKVLYIDQNTGAIDLVADPGDPNTLFAAMYRRQRTPWGYSAGGGAGKAGIYRTLDGGATWTRLTVGLPEGDIGRVGLDVYRRDGNLVYATVEARREDRGVYRSRDRGETWEKLSDRNPRPMYFSLIRIDPNDPERIWMGGVALQMSADGGRTWQDGDAAEGIHVDHHALWIDPSNSSHIILGNDGGVASTWDRGDSWRHHNNLAVGQFYQIGVDMRDPYYVCGGLQDNSSWCGPNESLTRYGVRNADWYVISGGDGFYNEPDPTNPLIVYTESQGGNIARYHVDTGEQQRIRPVARPTPDDTAREYRFNWNAPIHISEHDPRTVYISANHVLRSRDRGVTWEEASPDLTRRIDRDTLLIMGDSVTERTLSRNDGVSRYGTITTFGESPLDANVLYVGTDDGKLSRTRDGGTTWTDITGNVPGLRHGFVVSAVEPSRHAPGRVYLAYDGHYSDDYGSYVFVSEDYGGSWRRITSGLPAHSVNVVREHPRTPGLLFLGNEVGAFVSFDRGGAWQRLSANLPTVPVDDIVIHPRDNDLVLGTHGRSIWILDDLTPLEDVARDRALLAARAHLFEVADATMRARAGGWSFWGDLYAAENPPDGAVIRYWLGQEVAAAEAAPIAEDGGNGNAANGAGSGSEASSRIEIMDAAGQLVRTLDAPATRGFHQVVWDLRHDPPYEVSDEERENQSFFNRAPNGPLALPGSYTARLVAGDTEASSAFEVRSDPRISVAAAELEARRDAVLELNTLVRAIRDANEAAEKADSRIESIRKTLADADADASLTAEADSLAERLGGVREELNRARRGGFLAFSLEAISAQPTADQLWQIEDAWERTPAAIGRLNELLAGASGSLAALEARVYTAAARPAAITAVQIPERQ
ncbi:MAG: hypothetical protein ACRELD_04705 [Longimicrobiales bacterium]